MRIGLFHTTLPAPGRKLGGVEVFVHRLGSALVQRGHVVTVWSVTSPPGDAPYAHRNVGGAALANTKAARLGIVPALLSRVRFSKRADVLHLHGDDWFFLGRDLPTVRTFHGSAWHEARTATSMGRRILQAALVPAEMVSSRLATASYAVGSGMPWGYRLDGVLPLGFWDPPPRAVPRSSNPTILFVGTWKGRKRGSMLADVFRTQIRPRVPNAELWMVSDHVEPGDGVIWHPHPTDTELSELYTRCWAVCLPSTYEGFGMPYVEGMLHRTPVVATPNIGSLRHLRGGAGLLASDEELGARLVDLLSDHVFRQELADRGRSRAEAFLWPQACRAHEEAYAAAIERWQRRGGRQRRPAAVS